MFESVGVVSGELGFCQHITFAWKRMYSMRVCVCICAHPVVKLRGELGLEAADGSFAVVSLYKHLRYQRCVVPQLLQVMELSTQQGKSKHVKFVVQNTFISTSVVGLSLLFKECF